jgi:hypothetical protein
MKMLYAIEIRLPLYEYPRCLQGAESPRPTSGTLSAALDLWSHKASKLCCRLSGRCSPAGYSGDV